MNELDELALKYGTDKFGKHNYTGEYFKLFNEKRYSIKKVLEIGPAEGAGLFMFRDFFPNAMIYGAEVDLKRVDKLQNLDRIEVHACDQSSAPMLMVTLEEIGYDIDIVIDDGSHKPEDQIFTCVTLMPLLNRSVTYIIEDVADPTIFEVIRKMLGNDFEYEMTTFNSSRYDDRIIMVRYKQ